jgi:ribosomal protein S4
MTPETLRRVGEALYGERWQTALASDLGVADRTMRRWLSGASPVPTGISDELRQTAEQRLENLQKIVNTLRNASNSNRC